MARPAAADQSQALIELHGHVGTADLIGACSDAYWKTLPRSSAARRCGHALRCAGRLGARVRAPTIACPHTPHEPHGRGAAAGDARGVCGREQPRVGRGPSEARPLRRACRRCALRGWTPRERVPLPLPGQLPGDGGPLTGTKLASAAGALAGGGGGCGSAASPRRKVARGAGGGGGGGERVAGASVQACLKD